MKNIWFYDIECFSNFFCVTFKEKLTKTIKIFIIHTSQNDTKKLIKFLNKEVSVLIGYNNLKYDYPMLHWILDNRKLITNIAPDATARHIYAKSQEIINAEFSEIRKPYIIQRDLYRICHFDNKARATSLKALEIAMRMDNVEDMPYSHTDFISTEDQIKKIVEYNIHDVNATELFYYKILDKLQMRQDLSKTYGLNLMNHNDPKIGETIFVKILSEHLNIPIPKLRKLRTPRDIIHFKECILPKIKFTSKEFTKLLIKWLNTSITETKGSISDSVIYKGFKYDYGTGGIHGCIKSGVYEADDNYMICDIDVASYYPNLAITNNFFPEHLGEAFCGIYKDVYESRAKAKKEGNDTVNAGLKLALNGVYGKSNDEHSPFYDPKFTMQITLNGQLLLSMLAERIVDSIEDCTMLQINTDGLTIKCPRNELLKVDDICRRWEKFTGLVLEDAYYSKMVIRDVNNYLAVYEGSNKVKYKGVFEIDKDWNKDHSMRIVRIALSEYYIKEIPVKYTILNHLKVGDYETSTPKKPINNYKLFDFCKRFRATKGWTPIQISISENNDKQELKLQKNVRYFISKKQNTLLKYHEDGRKQHVEKDFTVTTLNSYNEKDISFINYNYYIHETNKIINDICDGQMTLF
jgi:DNA polymerase elongation subunit (family B)